MAVDVHPLHPMHIATATVTAGAAAQKREEAKVKLYGEHSRRAWGFTAFVAETTGAWGQAAQRATRALARAKSMRSGDDPQEVAQSMWDSLSRAVASSVARQLVCARLNCGALGKSSAPPVEPSPQPGARGQAGGSQAASGVPCAGSLGDCGPAAGDLLLACASELTAWCFEPCGGSDDW